MSVYFARIGIEGPVKIGYAEDVPARLAQLEAHYGAPMILLHTEPGGRVEEQAWHARFDHLRLGSADGRGAKLEQFRPAADLMDAIGRPLLVSQNPEAIEAVFGNNGVVTVLKGSPEYKAWLSDISAQTLIPITSIIRDALRKWADDRGLPGGPER